ncbi:MAG: aspartate/tyrosine/aromatic aminotransferase [Halioglobus sp.]|jgi:aspartate aminotransferase|nr:aminotransferase, classes I and II superfamily [marine gamma proteobacterium HTCC2148]MDG1389130.1 aspartate/tyrosine/aromatic aminotransferase [Halioglobus sp.]MDG2327233.1 aspartate/tyrosine/aromatic aminotransferase [Halioglobus sp.]
MLDKLERLPADSILGLAAIAKADANPNKVDLTVGVYMNEDGVCPVFKAVKMAQAALQQEEVSKSYLPPAGVDAFNDGMQQLLFGAGHPALRDGRVSSVQAPGGCGALRIGAEIIFAAAPTAKVWVSDPTWPVHLPLLGSVGLEFETYRYYEPVSHGVNFDGMVEDLKRAQTGDVVLLHGCCHNPCGADLSLEQWGVVADMAEAQGFVPFVDIAYQGLGDGLEEDAAGLRLLAERVPEMIIAASCSKNMGLYRERTGAVMFVCQDRANAEALVSQALVAARRVYSMPPAHGALIAGRILSDQALDEIWRTELVDMCGRMNGLRTGLREKLEAASSRDFAFIEKEKGMFSFLGLSTEQAIRLREEYSVYMLDSSRINVAGVNARNIDYLAQSVASVL